MWRLICQYGPRYSCTTPCLQAVELMAQHFGRWAGSPSMPEMAHLATVHLRKLLKQLPAERFRTTIRTLVSALESSCSLVVAARSSRPLKLTDTAALQAFPSAVKAEQVSCAASSETSVCVPLRASSDWIWTCCKCRGQTWLDPDRH